MTHRPKDRQRSLNSWSALLAVLLGALAGAVSGLGMATSFAAGPSIAGHSADARTPGNPASVRPDAFDLSLNLGGLNGADAALAGRNDGPAPWTAAIQSILPAAFGLPISVARVRDGRSRAPPAA